jgi:HEAT repeat protein
MTEWDTLDLEMGEDREKAQRRAALWQVLEGERAMPEADHLGLLSGLLDDDLLRMRTLWVQLSQGIRFTLLSALVELADEDFTMDFSAIFRLALRDPDAAVRVVALRGLREVEDARLVPELVRMLREDPSVDARCAAAEGLGKFVLLGELQKLRPDPFRRTVQALRDTHLDRAQDLGVRRLALESIAYTGEHGVPEIIETAYAESDAGMRRSALVAMGRSADARWSDIVQRELLNPNQEMRYEAARACGELQIRESVRELVALTDDVDDRIQAAALWALGQIGGNLARKTLQRYAESGDKSLAHAAEEALQELEFFHGDLSSFFGPPESYDGETDEAWHMPTLMDIEDEDDDDRPYRNRREQIAGDEDDPDRWDDDGDDEDDDYEDDLDIYDIIDAGDDDEWD